ncbi:MAG: MFS transporter, partial [Planctomycetota bacterium]|nr:MFS transporter [Planctomycetota bacterium]
MSEDLKTNNQATFERYKVEGEDAESTDWGMTFTRINPVKMNAANGVVLNEETKAVEDDSSIRNSKLLNDEEKTVLLENCEEDALVVKSANLNAGRQALIWTAYVPFIMGVGFLGLLLYYRSIGGYKALTVSESGELVPMDSDHGSHEGSSDDAGGASSDEA